MTTFDALLKDVGREIAMTRKSRGLRQTDVAEKSGISYRYLQSIESGKANVTLSTLFRLAQLFGVDVGVLIPRPRG